MRCAFFKNLFIILILGVSSQSFAEFDEFSEFSESAETSKGIASQLNLSGFVDLEQGVRISGAGPAESLAKKNDFVLSNARLRLKSDQSIGKGQMYFMVDFNNDEVLDKFILDIREARFQYTLGESTDINVGRQVSTWGVGDLVFINDLFPKNWVAHFSGRDLDMIKDPANSIRLTHFRKKWTFDLVWTPQFTPDTVPQACRFEVFDPNSNQRILNSDFCENSIINRPDTLIDSSEVALAVKRKIKGYDLAFYGYRGFYKNPRGFESQSTGGMPSMLAPYHPRLEVYGLSLEGALWTGILSFEAGYYNSKEDQSGRDLLIENSALKHLVGYRMDLSKSWMFGVQWMRETMMNYSNYVQSYNSQATSGFPAKWDENRDTFTLRLGFNAQQETLFFNFFGYIRPQDRDFFYKFEILKRLSNAVEVSMGLNLLDGSLNQIDRDFGMLKDADNGFVQLKYIF